MTLVAKSKGETLFYHTPGTGDSSTPDNTETILPAFFPDVYAPGGFTVSEAWMGNTNAPWHIISVMTNSFVAGVQTGETLFALASNRIPSYPGGSPDAKIESGLPFILDPNYGGTQALYLKYFGAAGDAVQVGIKGSRSQGTNLAPNTFAKTRGKMTAGAAATEYFNMFGQDSASNDIPIPEACIIETLGCTSLVGTKVTVGYADDVTGINFVPMLIEAKGYTNMASLGIPVPSGKYLLLKVEGTARTTQTPTAVSAASDAVITSAGHGLSVGDFVYISGVTNGGNPSVANGYWRVKSTPDANTFSIEADTSAEIITLNSPSVIPSPNVGHYVFSYVTDFADPRRSLLWKAGTVTNGSDWVVIDGGSVASEKKNYFISHVVYDFHEGLPPNVFKVKDTLSSTIYELGFKTFDFTSATFPYSKGGGVIPCGWYKQADTSHLSLSLLDYRSTAGVQANAMVIYEEIV
jgi:hypothetical protein